jgi:polyisoprenoid-binding protein YceI
LLVNMRKMIVKTKWQIAGLAGLNALLVFAHTAHAAPLEYVIDPVATKTTYETKYLGFITVRGIFTRMTGMLHYDASLDANKSATDREANIHVVIDATTLKPTNFDSESKRQMLRGPEFFNVEKFPTIEFKSSKFRYQTNSHGEEKLVAIDGMVKLVGQTKPTTLNVIKSHCDAATTTHPARCTATTEWIVKRFEYGMNGWANTVSDEVKISVDLVAVAAGGTASNDKK